MTVRADKHRARITGVLLGGGLFAVLALSLALVLGCRAVDRISRRAEQDQLANGMISRLLELEAKVVPQVGWDDAVRNLDRRFDPAWAQANIGAYLTETAGFQRAYVLDRSDRPVFAREGQETLSPERFNELAPSVLPLVRKVRELEAERGPFRVSGPSTRMISSPIQASSLANVAGETWVLTASLVQPDFGGALPSLRAPVVVTGRRVDQQFVAEMAKRYLLQNARLASPNAPASRSEAEIVLRSATGEPISAVRWTAKRPGAQLTRRLRWPLVLGFFLLCVVIVFFHRLLLRAAAEVVSTQDELRHAAQRAEASERAKSEFLANMSHEIRTPLNGVIGVAELLARSRLSREQKSLVETIQASGRMLDRLLLDVLDISKLEAGRLSICNEPFSIEEETRSVVALWRPKAEERGLEFICDIEPAAAAQVTGDAVRLRQILSNLISNAVKFTERGSVTLTVKREGGRFVFAVADTGIGFDEAARERLFARFEQADGSITRRFGGTGLGLAISRNLATLMDGELDAVGRPSEGAVFTLALPLAPVTARAVEAQTDDLSEIKPGFRVLAADDHNINRKVVRLTLEMMGAAVTLANDGREALELFATERFDLILMDMQMPEMDGLTATREIRRREAEQGLARTPIIMLTANAGDEHVAQALAAGADGHVTKPLKPDMLLGAINALPAFAAAA